MTLTAPQRVAAQQQVLRPQAAAAPPKTLRRFTVWMGSSIPAHYTSVAQIAEAARALVPAGQWDEIEVLLKAGEGGSWQSTFDSSPLAIGGPIILLERVQQGITAGVRITPYVIVRARPEWVADEVTMIQHCVQVAGRCVLNVEPGSSYYDGPTDPINGPPYIRNYLRAIGAPAETLEVCMIPRAAQVAALGGTACLQAWTDPAFVGSASWETYDASAGIPGPTSLIPSEAIPRLDGWGVPPGPQYRICVVQRSRISVWAETPWCSYSMAVWWLDGD